MQPGVAGTTELLRRFAQFNQIMLEARGCGGLPLRVFADRGLRAAKSDGPLDELFGEFHNDNCTVVVITEKTKTKPKKIQPLHCVRPLR